MAEPPNYHIYLWPEPPGSPSTYLCLVPECTYANATEAEILAHTPAVHGLEPVPTPLAASVPFLPTLLRGSVSMIGPTDPTYWTEVTGEDTTYHCAYCVDQGTEHHASDLEFFTLHMAQRHDGRMLEGAAPVVAAAEVSPHDKPEGAPDGRPDTPPGQEGTQPGNRPDVPPGHVEEPEPTHPIQEPDAEPEKV